MTWSCGSWDRKVHGLLLHLPMPSLYRSRTDSNLSKCCRNAWVDDSFKGGARIQPGKRKGPTFQLICKNRLNNSFLLRVVSEQTILNTVPQTNLNELLCLGNPGSDPSPQVLEESQDASVEGSPRWNHQCHGDHGARHWSSSWGPASTGEM